MTYLTLIKPLVTIYKPSIKGVASESNNNFKQDKTCFYRANNFTLELRILHVCPKAVTPD